MERFTLPVSVMTFRYPNWWRWVELAEVEHVLGKDVLYRFWGLSDQIPIVVAESRETETGRFLQLSCYEAHRIASKATRKGKLVYVPLWYLDELVKALFRIGSLAASVWWEEDHQYPDEPCHLHASFRGGQEIVVHWDGGS